MAQRLSGTWIAFLGVAFLIVGLAGLFATYAAPLPLQRALAYDAVFDAALAARHAADPEAALQAVRRRPEAAGLTLTDGSEAGLQAERTAMRRDLLAEQAATATRLRGTIILVTLTGFLFATVLMGIGRAR